LGKIHNLLNHLNDFNPKIWFIDLTPELIRSFKSYLEEVKGFKGSTMKVYFDKFRKIIRHAEKENYLQDNQARYLFDDIVIKVKAAKRTYLEVEEIKKLKAARFNESQKSRERDRDLFLFQIYTGYYYNDLKIMRKSQIVIDPQYGNFIMGERDKNGRDTIIPLFKFPHAEYILNKYKNRDLESDLLFLPALFVNSHVYNRTLKKIAKDEGIKKIITGKVARHTNAQLWIRYGASRPVVSKMLGHTKEESTNQYYAINIPEIIEGTKNVDFVTVGI
jgi:integrase